MEDAAEPRDEAGLTEREFLARYDPRRFPPMAVTVDVVVLAMWDSRLSVLLVRRRNHPALGRWALPGGFVERDEDLDDAARRELEEETGISVPSSGGLPSAPGEGVTLQQLRAYGAPGRDPRLRVVSVAYVATLARAPAPRAGSDAANARFWPVHELRAAGGPRLAFDHDRIVADALGYLRDRVESTPFATGFLVEPFTLSELRRVYEEIWGEPQEPEEFRRRALVRQGFLVQVDRPEGPSRAGAATEPLYRRGPARWLVPPLSPRAAGEPAREGHPWP
ncbi:MAG TPA: NUDIX domain-containing protein [Candidatus Dormibacteraeota bacterium]|nr:NUDIX domain-containing protein [Candidatus Dormibacteraeota bacterium]